MATSVFSNLPHLANLPTHQSARKKWFARAPLDLPHMVAVLLAAESARVVLPALSDEMMPYDSILEAAIDAATKMAYGKRRLKNALDHAELVARLNHPSLARSSPSASAMIDAVARTVASTVYEDWEPSIKAALQSVANAVFASGDKVAWKAQFRWISVAFRGASGTWNRNWGTSDVVGVARGIFESLKFYRMPILADALQDADCDNEELLARLRDPGSVFTRADLALTGPLGIRDRK